MVEKTCDKNNNSILIGLTEDKEEEDIYLILFVWMNCSIAFAIRIASSLSVCVLKRSIGYENKIALNL
jgi:hypothetical protein